MTKQTATRWYIGAWSVCALTLCALAFVDRGLSPGTAPPGATVAYIVIVLASVVMFVTWLAALFDLSRRSRWMLLGAVLVAQLVFFGLVGMLAYALLDRRSHRVEVVIRPATT